MNNLRDIKIIYLEDDEIVRNSASKFLSAVFDTVHIVQEGLEAIDVAKNIHLLDVLLTDVNMPGIDGIDTAVEIRKKFPECKVIFLTAYQSDELRTTIESKVKSSYILSKPIRLNKLVETINNIMGEAK